MMSRKSRAIVVWCGAVLAGAGYGHVQAARPSAGDLLPSASHVVQMPALRVQQAPSSSAAAAPANLDHAAVFKRYCVTCHNEKLKTGGLLLDKMDVANLGADGEKWEKVVRKLRSRAMPPAGMPRPADEVYESVATRLETDLDRLAAASRNPGRVPPFHRLTRTEYRNAIRDLLALTELPKALDLEVLLPADNSSTGFDNLADLLFVSSTQLEQYLSTAQKVSRLAVCDPTIPPIVDTYRMSTDYSQDVPVEGMPPGTRGGTTIRTFLPLDGEYYFHVTLAGAAPRDPVYLEISVDGERARLFTISDKPEPQPAVRLDPAPPENAPRAAAVPLELDPGTEIPIDTVVNRRFERDRARELRQAALAKGFNVVLPLKAGPRVVTVTFVKRPSAPVESMVLGRRPNTGQGPGVASITIRGPQNPTGSGDTPSRRRIFICQPTSAAQETPCARQILSTLARRAYRRPVTDADLQPLMAIYNQGRADGGFVGGIEQGLERILVSPQFLFRIERDPANAAPGSTYRISDIELASRLSFFLWSSIPDDTLLDAAIKGQLKDPTVLSRQVRRMLADPRAASLSSNFASQWLYLRDIDSKNPSPRIFPSFDLSLIPDFHRETELFLEAVLREDRSVLELLTADYTFLNERLADHYGIPGVFGPDFRRVTYPNGSPRRGLLGHGSILTLTSYANRTSPVLRGKYVLANILGAPPPPPPANVPALVTDNKNSGKPLSMREAMAQHRTNPACAGCHARMDPIGFALDNFDAVGRYRTVSESGEPIDSSGTFPDGSKFDGMDGLREVLLSRPEEFVLTMTGQMLTYSLGRSLEYFDAPILRAIVRDARSQDYRFSALVAGIVKSMPFQTRRAVAPGATTEPKVTAEHR
jgi:mono/diheme cytochrome c family protein